MQDEARGNGDCFYQFDRRSASRAPITSCIALIVSDVIVDAVAVSCSREGSVVVAYVGDQKRLHRGMNLVVADRCVGHLAGRTEIDSCSASWVLGRAGKGVALLGKSPPTIIKAFLSQ